jgi:hypothetical protein
MSNKNKAKDQKKCVARSLKSNQRKSSFAARMMDKPINIKLAGTEESFKRRSLKRTGQKARIGAEICKVIFYNGKTER